MMSEKAQILSPKRELLGILGHAPTPCARAQCDRLLRRKPGDGKAVRPSDQSALHHSRMDLRTVSLLVRHRDEKGLSAAVWTFFTNRGGVIILWDDFSKRDIYVHALITTARWLMRQTE
jgi:hypothetical protein